MLLAGRGYGKTRIGAEESFWRTFKLAQQRWAVVSSTASDLRRVCFEGESGLLAVIPKECYRKGSVEHGYNRANQEIYLENGSIISGFSAEKPERLRGPQFHGAWVDELAAWHDGNNTKIQETWDMLMFCIRLGQSPSIVVTTTPKPLPIIMKLKKQAQLNPAKNLFITGSTYDNLKNLSPAYREQILQYEGTALGKQEIHAEILDLENMGIYKRDWFKRWPAKQKLPKFSYIIQSYDTAFTEKTSADPTAHTTWGVFRDPVTEKPAVMLLDAWDETLAFPSLRKKVEDEFDSTFGPEDKEVDVVLIEKKGSGISLLQVLRTETSIPLASFDPKTSDKIERAHATSHFVYHGMIYLPEGRKTPGQLAPFAETFLSQMCLFPNAEHDDYVDTFTQAMIMLSRAGLLGLKANFRPHDAEYEQLPSPANPYAQ